MANALDQLYEIQPKSWLSFCLGNFSVSLVMFPSIHPSNNQFLFDHLRSSDLQNSVATQCVQLHGGWGYMWEYPIAK